MPLAFSRTVRPLESENILDIIAYIIAFQYIILTIVAMATRFVIVDRNTPLLLPPDLRDWVPADHLAHFVIDAMEAIDLREVRVNTRGTGDAQYPPGMLLGLLTYSYATGTFGSRRIEQSTYDNVAVRLITGDTHPDHDTICTFRRENKALVSESFVKILQLAQELKLVKFGQLTVSVDGTKIAANASKHAAVSYARAGEQLAQLELEVEQLLAKAEQADATPLQDGLTIPEEIARRQERKAAIAKARVEIEARAHARYALELAEHEKKMADRQAQEAAGQNPRGRTPAAPTPEPKPKDQYNYTDPESRIMKDGTGFEQSYNAQAAVEVESRLIVGERVSQAPNDKRELVPTLAAIPAVVGPASAVLTDNGFYSEAAVQKIEQTSAGAASGTTVYAPLDKTSHHRSVADLEKKPEPSAPAPGASVSDVMRHRLQSSPGKQLYKLRQQTVEPVFGIIKSVLGFRQFLLRGTAKVSNEWTLVCLAYNLKRLHRLCAGQKLALAR
jgi:transposase